MGGRATYEIDTNNELGFAAIGIARHFGWSTRQRLRIHVLHALLLLLHLIVGTAITRGLWGTHLLLVVLSHVALLGVDWSGVMGHLLLARWHRTLRAAGGSVIRVAGRSTQLLGIHGKAGLARARGWGGTGGGGGRCVGGINSVSLDIGGALAFGTETQALEARAHDIDCATRKRREGGI